MSTIVGEVKYIIPKLYQSYRWFVVLEVVTRTAGRSIRSYNRSCLVPLEGFEPPTRDLGRRRSILAELQGHDGGDRGARTPNLGDANAALSQLSYIPIFHVKV